MAAISVTLDVSNPDKSNSVKLLHLENIPDISVTFFVMKFDKLIFVRLLHSTNI